ncbi:hypothetical protein W97_02296 [Coniosporium apollinis CBS 100218]|uniref:Uncharacterized protein n=1 Tax=Coniosporium apollinis (strain CBS 100218) TaxID=1168221 RepID=R7YMN1_CONA1|nr:uncharacterized protein W97_02296 [Coniosporium apollinis CBS 100218]EON63069.1 hypothetical protein W97_02296 [Coniosporium apollinis CBS 100218]
MVLVIESLLSSYFEDLLPKATEASPYPSERPQPTLAVNVAVTDKIERSKGDPRPHSPPPQPPPSPTNSAKQAEAKKYSDLDVIALPGWY